ncbi:MAG: helix-turn-helix domain-containing protein [Planctomycetota bacterium]
MRRFARQYNREDLRFDTAVWQLFQAYPWPGNIRQLENAVERCVLLTTGPWIHLDALPAELQEFAASHPQEPVVAPSSLVAGLQFLEEVLPLKQALEGPERAILVHALRSTGGNRSRAAELLDINRTTLFHKMRKHGLMEDSFGSPA